MVPGNHDMNVSSINKKNIGKYETEVDKFLSKKKASLTLITSVFSPYSEFRKTFICNENASTYINLYNNPAISNLAGMKVFDKDKIVFIELNSSWNDLPRRHKRYGRFGDRHMQFVYNEVINYKRKGFFIVTLFHHSLRYLTIEEYQTREPCFPVYDKIIEMSDLCMSGHDHGSKSKIPDMLGNDCQYILNGGFFSEDKNNRITESCATLIKIIPYKEHLILRQFVYTIDKWNEKDEAKLYCSYSHLHSEKTCISNAELGMPATIAYDLKDKEKVYNRIVIQYFGEQYNISALNNNGCFFKLFKKEAPDINICNVLFMEMYGGNLSDLDDILSKYNEHLILICIIRKNNESDYNAYTKVKKQYKGSVLTNKIIIFPLINTIF